MTQPSRQSSHDPARLPPPAITATRYGTQMKFVIPSDLKRGNEVQAQILDEVAKHNYKSDNAFAIKLSLEESVVNAIKHGNKFDPAKRVFIEATVGRDRTEISIEDEGPGFHRTDVPDPTSEENLEKCSGRGILLIEAYVNSVSWSNDGRKIHIVKRND